MPLRETQTGIAEARERRDTRENAEYDVARNDQDLMEARIRQIMHTLEDCEVRAAAAENKVAGITLASPTSPVGSALLGAVSGETRSYPAPGGTFHVPIKATRLYEG